MQVVQSEKLARRVFCTVCIENVKFSFRRQIVSSGAQMISSLFSELLHKVYTKFIFVPFICLHHHPYLLCSLHNFSLHNFLLIISLSRLFGTQTAFLYNVNVIYLEDRFFYVEETRCDAKYSVLKFVCGL